MSLRLCYCWAILFFVLLAGVAAGEYSIDLEVDVEIDKGEDATYYNGEAIFISFRTNSDAYVVVYNIDSEGKLNLLFPDSADGHGFIPGYQTYQIPEQDDDYSLKVTGIDGEEYICAVASTAPLRIPSVFSEEAEFRASGDPDEIMHAIAEDMLDGREAPCVMDASHFYIGNEDACVCSRPLPPFAFPPCGCGCLEVVSKPDGASVYLDGRPFGKTPTVIVGIPPGIHELVIKKRLFFEVCKEICIDEGEKERVNVRLQWELW